ncbi:helix-turn-helix transcriptional regulator [Paenochrobactrum sp. BZR 588]|uniref:helix-turn-helix transcriptional regulator n=1 Tax=unclassified Paenochrobactrum TaxID=2639760 RepID=UPI0038524DB5
MARSPGQRILMLLKMHGANTAAVLGKKLGITGEAVRQQLVRLNEEGLVVSYSQSRGVGRPSQYWDLTALGHARFPDTHAQLTVQLLSSIRDLLGQDALDILISARENQTRELYQSAMNQTTSLTERVAKLAELRSSEGYMAEVETDKDGRLIFIENHCPICAAATACQGFCRAELNIFRALLGTDVKVEREEYILSGDRRCTYSIQRLEAH